MALHTPIDKNYKFGELFSIRNSYTNVAESAEMNRLEGIFFNSMMSYIVESGNLDKIERFARKNRTLCDFAIENAINEAYSNADISTNSINIPRLIKQKASKKAKMAVSDKAISIKTNSYRLPVFTKPIEEPTIYESMEDYEENDNSDIDKLVRDIANKNGLFDKSSKKTDSKAENDEGDITESLKHNYLINEIRLELTSTSNNTIDVFSVYKSSPSDEKTLLDSTMKNVVDCINASCKINFPEKDFIWINSGRPEPFLRGTIVVTSDTIKGGSPILNQFFGPAGTYKDYLYKADGTPRTPENTGKTMTDSDKDVNLIDNFPIVKVYAVVYSWDNINGRDTMRAITRDDFYGTLIKFVN